MRIRPSLRIQVGATRFRVPDVTVIDRNLPIEQILTHPPIAVFEVLSPEDTLQRLKRRLEDYKAMGIPEIWVSDPQDGAWYRYTDSQLLRLGFAFRISRRGSLGPRSSCGFPHEKTAHVELYGAAYGKYGSE